MVHQSSDRRAFFSLASCNCLYHLASPAFPLSQSLSKCLKPPDLWQGDLQLSPWRAARSQQRAQGCADTQESRAGAAPERHDGTTAAGETSVRKQVSSAPNPALNAAAPAPGCGDNIHPGFSPCCSSQGPLSCSVTNPAYFYSRFWHVMISDLDLLPVHLSIYNARWSCSNISSLFLKHSNSFNHLLFL